MMRIGQAYLVGAGPGDSGLITVKGLQCIREADVVIYDRLVNPALLKEAKSGAELIYVGKSAHHHTASQTEINRLIRVHVEAGNVVVRLKGGDPFIFGRGGEELDELVEAGMPFEVVPGITSAIAVPAYAGIPLTHREMASAVAFVTGHEDPKKGESAIDWAQLARWNGTLVFLMGVGNLPEIVQQLLAHGRSPATPMALIQWGTRPEQRTVSGMLAEIVEKVQAAGITSPAVIVVGEVVGLRERFGWYEKKPLFGKRVLVTRARLQASELTSQLEMLGAEVLEAPTIEIVPPEEWRPFDVRMDELSRYNWVVFTSVNGVEAVVARLLACGKDTRALAGVKIAAIGAETGARLRQYGLRVDFVPDQFVADELAAGLQRNANLAGARILLPRAAEARSVLPEMLRMAGAQVDEVAVYQTILGGGREDLPQLLSEGRIHIVTFTSSSTVRNFAELLKPTQFGEALRGVKVACIGPITAGTVQELGGHVDIIAEEHSIAGLVASLTARKDDK